MIIREFFVPIFNALSHSLYMWRTVPLCIVLYVSFNKKAFKGDFDDIYFTSMLDLVVFRT